MEPSQARNHSGLVVLYVEDEPETREMVGRAIADDYPELRFHMAADGAEGLELFRRHRPDLVITDIKMPGMDGIQMTGEMKLIDPDLEIIALTAYSDTGFLLSAIEAGFSHYVLKPVDLEKLSAAIHRSLEVVSLKRYVNKQNEQIREANRDLEAFNYTVAHDLRKPLTVINGYAQILMETCGKNVNVQCSSYLRETYETTLRMNRLIDTILRFSQAAHAEMKRKPVDLAALANEAAAELRQAEPERQVTFRIPGTLPAEGDPELLRVVLDNLFGNAWKYTVNRAEGVIELGATEKEEKRAYFVKDNGIGFDPKDAGSLFAPFQRLETRTGVGGLGIGLATVARIIQRHSGEVWAEGEPGKGATVYFTLGEERCTQT